MKRSFNIFQSIYIKIPLLIIFILTISFQFIGVFFIDQLETQSVTTLKDQINTQVDFLINNVSPILSDTDQSDGERDRRLNQALDSFSSTYPASIQIVNPQDYVLATSDVSQRGLVGTRTNNEFVMNVLINQRSFDNETLNQETSQRNYNIYKPIMSFEETPKLLGAVAVEADMMRIYEQRDNVMELFLRAAVFAVIGSFAVSIVLSSGLTRPIEDMRQQAIRISDGIYNYPAKVYGQDELGELALTLNDLAIKVKDAQELTESERQRLDGVLRHMTDGVIGTDQRGNVLLVNERALYLLGIPQEAAVGMSLLKLLEIEDTYTLKNLLGGDKEIMITRYEDDIDTILKVEFSVIRRETGFVTGLVAVLTDVTEQEKTDQERRDFVSNVSHELRTPLTSIKSYSEALADGAWQDPNIAPQFLEVIQSESNRMIRMIANLLDLSKMDGGQLQTNREYIDFKRIVNHILDRFDFTLASGDAPKKFRIKRELTTRDIYVEIDQDRMTQVIDNLMNNAIKYSPDGGLVTVRLIDTQNSVILSVTDQGLGIPQKDLPHLFERFYRVDKARSREQGGTGLGLAISKEVIEMHGGRIWVDSIEGKGSTFSFELPFTVFDLEDEGWDDFE